MCVFQATLLRRCADNPLVQRLLEFALGSDSRRHLDRLDRFSPVRDQDHVLLSLVNRAAATPFGVEHDFPRIRTPADFRRLVPLRAPAEFLCAYGRLGQAWPGPAPLVVPPPCAIEPGCPVRLTPELLAAQRRAVRTALAFLLRVRPQAPLIRHRIYWLGEDRAHPFPRCLQADELALQRFPFFLRCGVRTPQDWERGDPPPDPASDPHLGAESPSCILGPGAEIVHFLDQVRRRYGEGRLGRLWPGLSAILYTRPDPSFNVRPMRDHVGESVLLLEQLSCLGSPVAVEDPLAGGLRLLTDHGSYFEFVPLDVGPAAPPRRLGIGEVTTGVAYELILSSPAGVWGCRTGVTVVFDRLTPPLLRVLATPIRATPVSPAPPPATVSLLHPRTADTTATLRETVARIPW